MKDNNQREEQTDRHLDLPSEANRDKHVDFYNTEEKRNSKEEKEFIEQRRREWQQGLKQGNEERNRKPGES
jgi:hypothetical protein